MNVVNLLMMSSHHRRRDVAILRAMGMRFRSVIVFFTAQGAAVSGTWSETSRNINGNIEGRSSGGNFQVVATAPGFSANISLATRGNKQSVVIKAESQFKGVSISLSRT